MISLIIQTHRTESGWPVMGEDHFGPHVSEILKDFLKNKNQENKFSLSLHKSIRSNEPPPKCLSVLTWMKL